MFTLQPLYNLLYTYYRTKQQPILFSLCIVTMSERPKMTKHAVFFAQQKFMEGTGFLVQRNMLRERVVASCSKRE